MKQGPSPACDAEQQGNKKCMPIPLVPNMGDGWVG